MNFSGTIYAANALATITGNGNNNVVGGQYIVYDLAAAGNGNATVFWTSNATSRTRKIGRQVPVVAPPQGIGKDQLRTLGKTASRCDSLRSAIRITFTARMRMNTTRRPADIARRSANALKARPRDAFRRETFALPREEAREKAREMFRRFPKAAYMTEIESWRELPGDRIEFTMRRLPSAD